MRPIARIPRRDGPVALSRRERALLGFVLGCDGIGVAENEPPLTVLSPVGLCCSQRPARRVVLAGHVLEHDDHAQIPGRGCHQPVDRQAGPVEAPRPAEQVRPDVVLSLCEAVDRAEDRHIVGV